MLCGCSMALLVCAVGRVLSLEVCWREGVGRYVPQRVARVEICCRWSATAPWRYVLGMPAWFVRGVADGRGSGVAWRAGSLDFKSRTYG